MVSSSEDVIVGGMVAKYIAAASQEFERKFDVPWEKYMVSISHDGDVVIVSFVSKAEVQGERGAGNVVPGFVVKLKKYDYGVLNAQFVR